MNILTCKYFQRFKKTNTSQTIVGCDYSRETKCTTSACPDAEGFCCIQRAAGKSFLGFPSRPIQPERCGPKLHWRGWQAADAGQISEPVSQVPARTASGRSLHWNRPGISSAVPAVIKVHQEIRSRKQSTGFNTSLPAFSGYLHDRNVTRTSRTGKMTMAEHSQLSRCFNKVKTSDLHRRRVSVLTH